MAPLVTKRESPARDPDGGHETAGAPELRDEEPRCHFCRRFDDETIGGLELLRGGAHAGASYCDGFDRDRCISIARARVVSGAGRVAAGSFRGSARA